MGEPESKKNSAAGSGCDRRCAERRKISGARQAGQKRRSDDRRCAERRRPLQAAKEKAEAGIRAKDEFLGNMSHELRTPLNAIIGFSEVIQNQILGPLGNPKYLEFAGDIKNAGGYLLRIIGDILDISHIESGKIKLREAPLDVGRTVTACIRMLGQRAGKAGVTLTATVAGDVPGLHADEIRVKQILLNLIVNAIKFTPSGGHVTAEAAVDFDPCQMVGNKAGAVVLTVRDSGIGIAAQDIAKVLAPFGQVENFLTRRHEGVGLGLPIAKSMMEMHGGSLAIESEVGQGTAVTMRFPPERTLCL